MRSILILSLMFLVGCTGRLFTTEASPDGGDQPLDSGRARMDAQLPPGVDGGPGVDAVVPPGVDANVPPGVDANVPPGVDGGPPPMVDAGTEPEVDAGSCSGAGFADAFSRVAVAGPSPSGNAVHAAATDVGGVVAAWRAADGVHLTRIDGAGGTVGSDAVVPGNAPWGVAVSGDQWAALVDRGSDELFVVGTGPSGALAFETRLLGGVPHDVTENEWFGTGIRAGRLTWTGTQWAAYATVQRLWNDGVAHYGDTLRYLDLDGSPASVGWGWGCSHSMEVGIVHNGTTIGPVCVSDCFPDKGVFFNHRTEMFLDPSGNCAGRIDTRLGGIAAVSDGFWVSFVAGEGRSSMDVALMHVANDRTVGSVLWLTSDATADSNPHIAPYDGGLLIGWTAGGTDRLARVDASGAIIGSVVDVSEAGLGTASDFVPLAGGDVGWVIRDSGLAFARVRVCR